MVLGPDVNSVLTRVRGLISANEFEKAFDVINIDLSPALTDDFYILRSYIHFRLGQFLSARDDALLYLSDHDSESAWVLLGSIYEKLLAYSSACDALSKAIAISPKASHHIRLSNIYFKQGKDELALSSLRKACKIDSGFKIKYKLAVLLYKTGHFDESCALFESLLKINLPASDGKELSRYHYDINLYLSKIYSQLKQDDKASFFFSKCYPEPLQFIRPLIPFLDQSSNYFATSEFDSFSNYCSKNGFDFIPSFHLSSDSASDAWSHLLYLHIPKCGGTVFVEPILKLLNFILSSNHDFDENLITTIPHLNISDIPDGPDGPNLLNLVSRSCKRIATHHSSSFSVIHENLVLNHRQLLESLYGYDYKLVTTIRDPFKRLVSHLNFHAPKFSEFSDLKSFVLSRNREFYNPIVRILCGPDSLSQISNVSSFSSRLGCSDLISVDINDQTSIRSIKSNFLSSNSFPNILQVSRLNVSSLKSSSTISQQQLLDFANELSSSGYISFDNVFANSNYISKVQSSSLNPSSSSCKYIHPITFVFYDEYRFYCVPTERLFANPSKHLSSYSYQGR